MLTNDHMNLNAKVNPQIDLFARNFKDPEKSVLADRRKTEHHRKKSQTKPLKRSSSALQKQNKSHAFGKTFARMHIVKHMNNDSGTQDTIEKTVKMKYVDLD